MLLPLKRLLQPQKLLPPNAQLLRRNNIPPIRLPPITLRLKTPKHHRQLLAKLLPPNLLILLLPDLHKSHPPAGNLTPGLVVVAVRPLLGVDESVFRGGGDLRVGEDGGGEDPDVGVDVAGVVDVGAGADGLEGDVGAVAAGLGWEGLLAWGNGVFFGARWTYDFGGFHHGELPEVTREEADPEEGCLLCERGELGFDVVCGLVFALSSDRQCINHITDLLAKHTSI